MLTRRSWRLAGAVVFIAFAAIGLVAALTQGRQPYADVPVATSVDALPADIEALGLTIAAASTQGKVSATEALGTAEANHPADFAVGDVSAFLMKVTDPETLGPVAVRDRPVWLIRLTGLRVPVGGPVRADGTAADGGYVTSAYIYVDAITGEWLLTRYEG